MRSHDVSGVLHAPDVTVHGQCCHSEADEAHVHASVVTSHKSINHALS